MRRHVLGTQGSRATQSTCIILEIQHKAISLHSKIIEEGYEIEFTSEPPPFAAGNNQSSLVNRKFVDDALQALARETLAVPYCCNLLTAARGPEKRRLVVDLRHVNQYTNLKYFKYEDLSTFVQVFEEGDYFGTFDLKSGYDHVEIYPNFTKFLGFKWVFLYGEEKHYEFPVLPFGLNVAENHASAGQKMEGTRYQKHHIHRRWCYRGGGGGFHHLPLRQAV